MTLYESRILTLLDGGNLGVGVTDPGFILNEVLYDPPGLYYFTNALKNGL